MSLILNALRKSEEERARETPGMADATSDVEDKHDHATATGAGPPWAWISVGAVALAGAATAVLILTPDASEQPQVIAAAPAPLETDVAAESEPTPADIAAAPDATIERFESTADHTEPVIETVPTAVDPAANPIPPIEIDRAPTETPQSGPTVDAVASVARAASVPPAASRVASPSSPAPPNLSRDAEPAGSPAVVTVAEDPQRPATSGQRTAIEFDALPGKEERFREPAATPSLPDQSVAARALPPPPASRRLAATAPERPIRSRPDGQRSEPVSISPTPTDQPERPAPDTTAIVSSPLPPPRTSSTAEPMPRSHPTTEIAADPVYETADATETSTPLPSPTPLPSEPVELAALPSRPPTADEIRVASALYDEAWTLERDGSFNESLDAFTRAIALRPGFGDAYFGRAWVNDRLDRLDEAVADYGLAIQLNPRFPHAHGSRGVAQLYRNNLTSAEDDFVRALEIGDDELKRYAVLWRYLSRERDGRGGGAQLLADTRRLDLSRWPGIIARFYLGDATTNQVLSEAQVSDPIDRRERLCVAYFFLGQRQLLAGDESDPISLDTELA